MLEARLINPPQTNNNTFNETKTLNSVTEIIEFQRYYQKVIDIIKSTMVLSDLLESIEEEFEGVNKYQISGLEINNLYLRDSENLKDRDTIYRYKCRVMWCAFFEINFENKKIYSTKEIKKNILDLIQEYKVYDNMLYKSLNFFFPALKEIK